MILLLFFCSGATALIYEVVWTKYLSLMLGSTVQAQTVVLAVFMGGLALGNRIIGARSDLLQRPLGAYGYLEASIGVYAFFFSAIYGLADKVFVSIGSRVHDNAAGMFLLKAILSVGLLSLPTILMGGTLPLLAAWLQKQSNDAGRWSARFYSTNSLGAVCGAFLAGFFLIQSLGLVSTLQLTALLNVIVGIIAIGWSRKVVEQPPVQPTFAATSANEDALPMRGAILFVTLTGAVSMGLEVLASRSLALIFGASLQAFAVVLMAFILGIGTGSAAVASPRFRRWRSDRLIIGLLLTAACIIGLLVAGIEQWVEVYRHMRIGLAPNRTGYRFYQIMMAGFSIVLLGLPAALIGAVLPLCIRRESEKDTGFGRRVSRLLTWNTLGAVAGVLITGFILMPKAGLRNAFNLLALGLCLAAVMYQWRKRQLASLVAPIVVSVGLIVSCLTGNEGWRLVLSSGVFRYRETTVDPNKFKVVKQRVKILFYEDAPDATVCVDSTGEGTNTNIGLRINGKAEASTSGDLTTQLLLAHLPMLARPGSEDVFMLGLASGISCGGFLAYPIKHLTVADNCEPVTRAVDYFAKWNRGVRTNAVTRIRVEDARTVLKLDPKRYDVIVSEPSNPWFASVGSVFSREFYEIAAKRLKPGGIMVQWFHIYEMHDEIVRMVLRTIGSVFPVIEIWDTNEGDIVLLASDRPWDMSLSNLRRAYANKEVLKDMESIGLGKPEALLARLFASQRTASCIAGPGPVQSDGFPVLEYEAPVAFFIGTKATGLSPFDERTLQTGFAPEERRRALSALDDQSLRNIFSRDTINADLWMVVAERLKRNSSARANDKPLPLTGFCLFDNTNTNVVDILTTDVKEPLRGLIRARFEMQNGEGDFDQNAQLVRNALIAEGTSNGVKGLDKSAANFASVAARAAILHHRFDLASDFLSLGINFDPTDPEFPYLARLRDREAAMQNSKESR